MIERCTDDISNLFGHLACSGGAPTGSYLASCTSATLMRTGNGVTLFAQCSDGIAYQPTTSLLYSSCLNDPVNVLGSLSCDIDGGSGPSPPGSYRASCIIPELSGTTLGAVCRNASGSWGPGGIISDVTQCTRDIANVDGVLTCVQG